MSASSIERVHAADEPVGLAIDIGGTKTAAALVTVEGAIVRRATVPTRATEGAASILSRAVELGEAVAEGHSVRAVGVGSAGVIDRDGRVWSATGILTDWAGADVIGAFRSAFDTPVSVLNDAHAHAVGEAIAGAGRGSGTVLVVAVGTGIGGAVVIDGVPLLGAHGAAGHLGHVPSAAARGLLCSCGRDGHIEPLASGPGIHALYLRLGGDTTVATGRDVALRVATDPVAAAAVESAGSALGIVIGGLIDTIDPDIVVIGGSVQDAGDVWWRAVREAAAANAMPSLATTRIVPARLGPDAALIGAAHSALTEAER